MRCNIFKVIIFTIIFSISVQSLPILIKKSFELIERNENNHSSSKGKEIAKTDFFFSFHGYEIGKREIDFFEFENGLNQEGLGKRKYFLIKRGGGCRRNFNEENENTLIKKWWMWIPWRSAC